VHVGETADGVTAEAAAVRYAARPAGAQQGKALADNAVIRSLDRRGR